MRAKAMRLELDPDRVAVTIGYPRHRIGVDLENDLTPPEPCVIGPPPFHTSDVKGAADGFGHVVGDDRSLFLELQHIARDVLSILLDHPVVGQALVVDRVVLADPVRSGLAPKAVWPGLGSKFDDKETAQRTATIGETLEVVVELVLVLDPGPHRPFSLDTLLRIKTGNCDGFGRPSAR